MGGGGGESDEHIHLNFMTDFALLVLVQDGVCKRVP